MLIKLFDAAVGTRLASGSIFIRWPVFAIALLCMVWGSPANARKIALIIGNSAYSNTSALTNPANDAQLVASAARTAGFDVMVASDLTISSFQKTLRDFRIAADGSDVAMIYYAGHGIEGQGKNWLIPVDAKLETQFDLPYEAINMDRLLEALGGAQVRIVILDSCRNNPFGNAWKAGIRAVPMGLNGTEYDDVLVIYAAAPGQTATEGTGVNSPFATSLAKRIPEAGLPVQLLGGAVRDDVLAATGGKQRPFVSASITGTPIYLVGAPRAAPVQVAAATAPPVTTGGGDRSMLDALMWQGAVFSNTLGGFQAYLREFPGGVFSNVAKDNIAKLQPPTAPTVAVAIAPPVIATVPLPTAVAAAAPPSHLAAATGSATSSTAVAPFVTPQAEKTWAPGSEFGLPTMPATPRFSSDGYPNCRENYQSIVPTLQKIDAINSCTVALDRYHRTVLLAFRELMIAHQNRISTMYSEQVGGQMRYLAESKKKFYDAMMKEHAESNPDAIHFAEYRTAEARYSVDRAYLQDRYCFNTGCAGYTAPVFLPSETAKRPKK